VQLPKSTFRAGFQIVNPNERELTYPWAEVPALGSTVVLRPGLLWTRMQLPFALDHINLWLFDDEIDGRRGWTVIDTGLTSDDTKAAWEQIFDSALDGRPVLRVLCTHFHPDHVGLAWWLTQGGERSRWQAPLWMTATEYSIARYLTQARTDTNGASLAAHFRRNGLTDPDSLEKVRARAGTHYPRLVPAVPLSYRRIWNDEEISIGPHGAKRIYKVIVGHGHAPEHASLYCAEEELLISGDMVLPRISTNVSVVDVEPDGDPLPRYLHSIDRYLVLPAETLVLPSHGKPFTGLHRRIAQQHEHHQARLDEVLAACAQPRTGADIVPVMFKRELDLHQLTFALGEALAHLHALWYEGLLVRRVDADGIYRFQTP
jgi:glyoxylase-like metal-dependent hydrolase (beta-lactamase superfamily II)